MGKIDLGVATCEYSEKDKIIKVDCDNRVHLPIPCPKKKVEKKGVKTPAGPFIPKVKRDGDACSLTGFVMNVTTKRDLGKLGDDVVKGFRKLGVKGI